MKKNNQKMFGIIPNIYTLKTKEIKKLLKQNNFTSPAQKKLFEDVYDQRLNARDKLGNVYNIKEELVTNSYEASENSKGSSEKRRYVELMDIDVSGIYSPDDIDLCKVKISKYHSNLDNFKPHYEDIVEWENNSGTKINKHRRLKQKISKKRTSSGIQEDLLYKDIKERKKGKNKKR